MKELPVEVISKFKGPVGGLENSPASVVASLMVPEEGGSARATLPEFGLSDPGASKLALETYQARMGSR